MTSTVAVGGNIAADESLVLYLDAANPESYPGSGNIWYDLSRYKQNITLFNSPTFSNLGIGSIQFNGINQNGTVTLSPGITNSPFTISTWINSSSTAFQTIIGIGTSLGIGELFQMQIFRPSIAEFYFDDYSNAIFSSVPNLLNNWYNFTVTLNSSFLAKGYINGVLTTSNTFAGYLSTTSQTSIGNNNFGGNWYNGYMANYLIYNKVLSDAEVLQNYNALKSRFGIF